MSAARKAPARRKAATKAKPKAKVPTGPKPSTKPLGEHALSRGVVAGHVPRPGAKTIVISNTGPAAAPILADMLSTLWGVVRGYKRRLDGGEDLEPDDIKGLTQVVDATTKVLREERRQLDLDDWSRMSEAEIVAMLPPEYQGAFQLPESNEGTEG